MWILLEITSWNGEARNEEFPSQFWCQSHLRIRKEFWFEVFNSSLTGKRAELLAPELPGAPNLAVLSARTSLPSWNPAQHSSHGSDSPLPPAPTSRHQALPWRKNSLQRERESQRLDQCISDAAQPCAAFSGIPRALPSHLPGGAGPCRWWPGALHPW